MTGSQTIAKLRAEWCQCRRCEEKEDKAKRKIRCNLLFFFSSRQSKTLGKAGPFHAFGVAGMGRGPKSTTGRAGEPFGIWVTLAARSDGSCIQLISSIWRQMHVEELVPCRYATWRLELVMRCNEGKPTS